MELPKTSKIIAISPKRKVAFFLLSFVAAALRAVAWTRRSVPKKAVVLEPYGMGDSIATLPLLRGLKENGWTFHFASRSIWRDLLPQDSRENFVAVDLPWTSYDPSKKYGWKRLFASDFRESLSRLNPVCSGAVGLDQRGDIRSVILLYLAGCREVISTSNYMGADVFMPWWAARRVETPSSEHQWQIAERLLRPLGIAGKFGPPIIDAKRASSSNKIALLPAAPSEGRLWADDRWKELIVRLRALDCELIGICGPSQTAAAALSLGDVPVKEVVSIEEWKRVLSEVKIAITLDSGPMHLANAMGVPLVALFGQGLLPRWAPNGEHVRVVHHHDDPEFAPLHQVVENIPDGRKWMSRITVDEVFGEFIALNEQLDVETSGVGLVRESAP